MKQGSKQINILVFLLSSISTWAQPVEFDMELGEQYSQAVESQMGVYDDAALTTFVASVGVKLVKSLGDQPFDYSFKIADTDATNAFALPGGFTYVTRGLLALVNDESELAGVMAHEIIHVDKRHSVRQMNRSGLLPGLLRLPGQIVGAFSPAIGSLLLAPVDITAAAFKANYSRSHEKEADKEGVVLAANSGYNPNGLTIILENLATEVELLTGESEKSNLLDDHPITPKRLKYLDKEIGKIEGAQDLVSGNSVLDLLDGMIYGQNPEQGVIIDNKFMHSDMRLFMQYPTDWQTTNTPVIVGAVQKEGEALIILEATENDHSPKEFRDTLVSQIPSEYVSIIEENEAIDLNGFSGYSLILVDDNGTQHVYMHMVWLTVGNDVFQLTAFGLDKHRETLESSLNSFRQLSEDERSAIQVQHIRVTEARSGESLQEMSDRTGNVLDMPMTAVINGVEAGSKFVEGQKVKIVRQDPYVTK
jgi:predicted Zn-dependent protease